MTSMKVGIRLRENKNELDLQINSGSINKKYV